MHKNFAFMAPEVDNDFFHDKAVDLWSLGALICMMLTGLPPFRGNGEALIANKHNGNVVFDAVLPSSSAQLLVRSLLQVNPVDRWTIDKVLDSEWMIEEGTVLADHDLTLATTFMSDWTRVR
jgi:serine/threonine protein kinase